MENIRPFQIALLAGFGFLGILSLILLANFKGYTGTDTKTYGESVEIWGTLDDKAFTNSIGSIAEQDKAFAVVTYKQIDADLFVDTLTNALAEGRGPDAVVLPSDLLVSLRSKLIPIPYDTFSLRDFRNAYIDGAEVFARPDGIYAVPIAVDPLVLYWNRDLFSSAGIVEPPATWESFVSQAVPLLTKRDSSRTITQSAVAFGEYKNVTNAKPVMLTLGMQAGATPVVEQSDQYVVTLDQPTSEGGTRPFTSAMQFYLDFSNRNSNRYTWDVGQQQDRTAFLGERLAMYFGFGSERADLQASNPNLNFDVTTVPQGAQAAVKRTFGEYYGLAMVRASDNTGGTYAAARRLAAPAVAAALSESLGLTPVARSVLAAGSKDPYRSVFFEAAPTARGWLDPEPEKSSSVFADLVANVTSNRQDVTAAVASAITRLAQIF